MRSVKPRASVAARRRLTLLIVASAACGSPTENKTGGPGFTVVHHDNDALGFAYSVFERREGASLREVVVAYRGTELGFRDIFHGSITTAQNARGLAIYDEVRANTPREVPVNVTGIPG